MKQKYKIYRIGGDQDTNKIVTIDQTLITHDQGVQNWLFGAVETRTKKIR